MTGLLFAICRICCARSMSWRLPPINTWQLYTTVRRSASSANRSGGQALNQYRVPGAIVCPCVFSSVQEEFQSLLERRTSDWDLPEEQFLQCVGRSGHTILLFNGIDRDFSTVAKMTGNQRYRTGNQMVDQFAERDILPKAMFPESIQARH
jgi:hypothetical protein